jgi:hypothetical protein
LPSLSRHRFGFQLLTKRLEVLVICVFAGFELLERVAVHVGPDQCLFRSAVEQRLCGIVKQKQGKPPMGDIIEIG